MRQAKASVDLLAGTAVIVAMAVLPQVLASTYQINVLINAMIFIVLAMSLNIIYGYAGLLSFAQVGFWGLGGYTAALSVLKLGLDPWLGILGAAVFCAPIAVCLGAIALRLSNHAFVIVSIAFTLLLQLLAQEWISLTNGPMGLPGLPAPTVDLFGSRVSLTKPHDYFYFVLVFSVLSLAAIRAIVSSRVGTTLKMIKHDEVLARSYGIQATRWKLFAAGMAAAFAAMAGAVNVFYVSIIDPLIFDIYYTQMMLVIVIVGGLGSFWPVVVAGFVLTAMPELLRTPNEVRMINYGLVLIASVIFFPGGVASLWQKYMQRFAAPGPRQRLEVPREARADAKR